MEREDVKMTDNPYANVIERAQTEATRKGHELGDWKPRENRQGYVAICEHCGGELTVSGTPSLFLVGADPYMSLDFCPGGDPELMKAIDEELTRRLAKCYALLLKKAQEKRERENGI